jgi:hypothetical protein
VLRARVMRACLGFVAGAIEHGVKLAQHVSQLITHGTSQTIVQLELSLRVAELESAIQLAQYLASSSLVFISPD